jgi:hypothetical protein
MKYKLTKKAWEQIGRQAQWYGGETMLEPKFSVGDRVVVVQTISAEAEEEGSDTGMGIISEVIPHYGREEGVGSPIGYAYAIKFDEGTDPRYFDNDDVWEEGVIEEW